MANKKVFTTLDMQASTSLKQPRLHPTSSLPSSGLEAGQAAVVSGKLHITDGTSWYEQYSVANDATVTGELTFNRGASTAPFTLHSNAQGQLVSGLQAETLGTNSATLADGIHGISDTATEHGIPVYGTGGVLPVGTPTADGHAATKAYVDTTAQGLTIKDPVYVATTAELPATTYANATGKLTAQANNTWTTVDGIAVAAGKRILVKDQSSTPTNGIYTVTSIGDASNPFVLTRATDYDEAGDIKDGDFVFVEEGTDNANNGFVQTQNAWTAGSATLGSTAIAWTQFSGAGQLTVNSNGAVAAPLTKSGDTIDFRYSTDTLSLAGEMVENGDFSRAFSVTTQGASAEGWTNYNTTKISTNGSNQLVVDDSTGVGGNSSAIQNLNLTAGKSYLVSVDLVALAGTSPSLYVSVTGSATDPNPGGESWEINAATAIQTHTATFTATANSYIYICANGNSTVTVDNVSVTEVGALAVKSGGIDTVHLADDAVEPSKLLETGAFTMGTLTATGGEYRDGSWHSGLEIHPQAGSTAYSSLYFGNQTVGRYSALIWTSSTSGNTSNKRGAMIYGHPTSTSNTDLRFFTSNTVGSGGPTNKMIIKGDGKIGIGADATSPSGTLHVSTARYGSELITGDDSTFASGLGNWATGNNWNTQSHTNGTMVLSSTASQQSCYKTISALTVGRTYQFTYDASSITGTVTLATWVSSAYHTLGTFAAGTAKTFTFTHPTGANTTLYIVSGASGNAITLDNLYLKEDSLASASGATFEYANDLVVNNPTKGGITIIGNDEARLHFGSSGNSSHSQIVSKYDVHKDSTIEFKATDDGTTNTVMTVFGKDKSVKIETGGLGIGTAETTAGALTTTGAITAGGALTGTSADFSSVIIRASSTYYSTRTYLGDTYEFASDVTDGVTFKITGGAANTAGNFFKFQTQAGGETPATALTINKDLSATFSGALTAGGALTTGGILDHGGFPTVNSSTVQGLQDGAGYTLKGGSSGDYIASDAVATALAGTTVGTIRWRGKLNDGALGSSNDGDRLWSFGDTSANEFILFRTESTTNKLVGLCRDGANDGTNKWSFTTTSDFSENRIYDLVLVQNGTEPVLYVDGVQETLTYTAIGNPDTTDKTVWFDECTGLDNFRIGSSEYNAEGSGGSAFLPCTVLQVQVFPSALTAGDVRKLYSGENPKKNLNVEEITQENNRVFNTSPIGTSAWYNGTSSGVLSHDSSGKQLEIDQSSAFDSSNSLSSFSERTWFNNGSGAAGITAGKNYLMQFDAYASSGSPKLWVNIVNADSGRQNVTLTTAKTTFRLIFQDIADRSYLLFAADEATRWYLDNVSIQEVGTLVDFNPRSASSTKWYNAAIPALYNGTLQGGVTLSAGSTDHYVGGELTVKDRLTAGNLTAPAGYNGTITQPTKTTLLIPREQHISSVNYAGTGTIELIGTASDRVKVSDSGAPVIMGGNLLLGNVWSNYGNDCVAVLDHDKYLGSLNNPTDGVKKLIGLNGSNVIEIGESDLNVKINTSTTNAEGFEVTHKGGYGGIRATADSVPRIQLKRSGSTVTNGNIEWLDSNNAVDWDIRVNYEGGGDNFAIRESAVSRLYIKAGDVGISTQTPQGKLDVKGSIRGEADDKTVLLIHSDTTDGSTTFVDSSPSGHAITVGGHTHHVDDTYEAGAKPKFGASAMYFDGTGDYLDIADHADFSFGNGDFTVDFWVLHATTTAAHFEWVTYLQLGPAASTPGDPPEALSVNYHSDTGYGVSADINGSNSYIKSNTFIADTNWHHIAVTRSSTNLRIFLDGTLVKTHDVGTTTLNNPTIVRIGEGFSGWQDTGTYDDFRGYMDEFRISKGIARWTSDFTPPARPYSTVNDEFFNDYDKIAATGIGSDVFKASGPFNAADGNTAKGLNIQNVGNDTQASLRLTGHNNANNPLPGLATYTELRHRGDSLKFDIVQNGTSAIEIDSFANTAVTNRLGVGGDANASYQFHVTGTNTNNARFTSPDSSYSRIVVNASTANSDSLLSFQAEGGSKWSLGNNAGDSDKFQIRTGVGALGGSETKFTLDASGNCGIGTEAPQSVLDISTASAASYPLIIRGDIDNNGGYTGIRFGYNSTNTQYQKAAIQVRGTHGHVLPDMHFMLNSATGNATVADADADRVFTLRNAGTQDHWGNRIVNSQTVTDLHRTAEPSLRFDGSNDYVDTGSSLINGLTSLTIEAWIKPDTVTATQKGICGAYSSGIILSHLDSGKLKFYPGAGSDIAVTAAGTVKAGVWQHVAFVFKGGESGEFFHNGVSVLKDTSSIADSITNSGTLKIGSYGNGGYFDGEIKDVRIHNRALEATEVAAAYNGESTPWKYANAGNHTELVTNGSFTADDGTDPVGNITGWGSYGTATSRYIASNTFLITASLANSGAVWTTTSLEIGKTYRVSCTATGNLATNSIHVTGAGVTAGDLSTVGGAASGDFTCTSSGTFYVYFRSNPNGTGSGLTTYFDNFSIIEIGEVAAYTPQSINDKWYDTTSNANHGTIIGATAVGDNDHRGVQKIRGYAAGDGLLIDNTDHDRQINFARNGVTTARIKVTEPNASGTSDFKFYTSTAANSLLDLTPLTLTDTGEVKATSGTDTNLVQVARVLNYTIDPPFGNAAVVFMVNHGFSNSFVITSVFESAVGGAEVECDIRRGQWSAGSTGAGAGVTSGSLGSYVADTDDDWISIIFATAPADGELYKVTVMG